MTQQEIDKAAWNAIAELMAGMPMELVPSERTRKELLGEEEDGSDDRVHG